MPYVVVVANGADHGADYLDLLQKREEEAEKAAYRDQIERDLSEMQEQRRHARLRGDFALADALRAKIEAAGIIVGDGKITGRDDRP